MIIATTALGAAAWLLPAGSPAGWLLRVFGSSFVVCVAPGALTLLAWQPKASIDLLTFLATSLAVGFGIVQLLAFGAIGLHWSPDVSLTLLALWMTLHFGLALRRRPVMVITTSGAQLALTFTVVAVGACLYVVGSPFEEGEERIHVAIVQRLTHLQKPGIDNIYFVPNFVYTYPFPGTHYMLALMSRLGDIDALFLYHKLRAVWGISALLLLYGCTRAFFGSVRLASAGLAVALAFVVNGTFGAVPGFYWAQMAPYSHASDVAMGVLLPAMLLLALEFLRASTARARWFFFSAAVAMALMLIAVHPREMVQFLVYGGAFGSALLVGRASRQTIMRVAVLVGVIAAILVVYRVWHAGAVSTVDIISVGKRRDLADIFRRASWGDLVGPPLPLLRNYMPGFGPMFYGWNALVLLASPIVLVVLRDRTLSWMASASILTYALIIQVPLLAVPYVYLTYFEMLYSPIRNVVFFVHVLTGVGLYLVAARLARLGIARGAAAALITAAVLVFAFRQSEAIFSARPTWFFVALFGLYASTAAFCWTRPPVPDDSWIEGPPRPWALLLTLLVLSLAGFTYVPDSSLLRVSWSNSSRTPDQLLAGRTCSGSTTFCPPPRQLVEFAQAHVPVQAVFAVDRLEEFQPALFMPQQMVIWPGEGDSLMNPDLQSVHFPAYFAHDARSQEAYHEQPLFNDRETRGERLGFLRDLHATHILVNPRTYKMMRASLDLDSSIFKKQYDDGQWALYAVALR